MHEHVMPQLSLSATCTRVEQLRHSLTGCTGWKHKQIKGQ